MILKDKGKSTSSFNIMDHVLVPKHEVLSKEEAKEIIKKYGGNPYLFPSILADDPVVKALGAKPGDLIKIVRKSPTGREAIYYRLVVRE